MLSNIPNELKALKQWVCAGPNKIPVNAKTGQAASVTDPSTWSTFEEATNAGYKNVGFVLTAKDPYTIIDLDNKLEKPEVAELHNRVLAQFNSYTERSVSGKGYHIIVKGSIPAACKRESVEVYSELRYMICTGDVFKKLPIADAQSLLATLYSEMQNAARTELTDEDEVLSDREINEMAINAVNGDKFTELCNGEWARLGYPSQSEADFALLSMLAFYSKSNEQVRRLFRMSALGKRDKAIKNDKYIDTCLEKIRAQLDKKFEPVQLEVVQNTPSSEIPVEPNRITPPPGIVGEIAEYIYSSSIRPVPEISLAASLALTAGIVGRSYNISGTGLNQYIIVIAETGVGKESAVTGIDNIIAQIRPHVPVVDQFIGPSAFASGQALIKVLDERQCFVSVLGEFGLTLQAMCDSNASPSLVMLRKVLLDLYSKSGWSKTLRPSVYSDKEKNTKLITSPNVTLFGEATPDTFFEGLNAGHIAEGLVPRFTTLQYKGNRPGRNQSAGFPPSSQLTHRVMDLVNIALSTGQNNTVCNIVTDQFALKLLDEFDKEADEKINAGGENSVLRQLWNRAHLKALKMAGLIAVGCDAHNPVVKVDHAQWAINLVRGEIKALLVPFEKGDVGSGDSKARLDLMRQLQAYLTLPTKSLEKASVTPMMYEQKIIPYSFLQSRTASLASFRKDRRGSVNVLKTAIQELVDSDLLAEVPPNYLREKLGYNGRAWTFGKSWRKTWKQ